MFILSSRAALKRLQLAPQFVRRFGHAGQSQEEMYKTALKWKRLSLYVAFPTIIVCAINSYILEKEHLSHPRKEFKKYDHLYIRTRPFPWGDGTRTLFHHPVYNALPDGYEAPDPNEHKRHEHH